MNLAEIKATINRQPDPDVSYPDLRSKIRAEKRLRLERYDAFEALLLAANAAGVQAAAESPYQEQVPVGGCGFAWVRVFNAGSSFGRWLVKEKGWTKHYRGGVQMSVSSYGQSEPLKMAYASAYAATLRAVGINAYPGSYLN
jgi:hypothetical protein